MQLVVLVLAGLRKPQACVNEPHSGVPPARHPIHSTHLDLLLSGACKLQECKMGRKQIISRQTSKIRTDKTNIFL